jgi:HIRAN domain
LKTLYLAWQDQSNRSWFPIGRLTSDGATYRFVYVNGAQEAQQQCGFQPLWLFPDLNRVYESPELFPLFTNRILRPSRPDYPDFIQWLNIPPEEKDEITLLGRSGGQRATDSFEVFPSPEPDNEGFYHLYFFVHGIRHRPPESQLRLQHLNSGDCLLLMHDFQNSHDNRALMIRTEDGYNVGYCPRYLLDDVFELLRQLSGTEQAVKVTVERVNLPPTPIQFRLLCKLTAAWPEGFRPFAGSIYQPIVESAVVVSSAV